MSLTPRKICPVCKKTGLKYLRQHLRNVHELTVEERKEMLKHAVYNIPTVSADSSSTAMNMDFMKEETYPSTSDDCEKDLYVQEWLKKQEKVYVQVEE